MVRLPGPTDIPDIAPSRQRVRFEKPDPSDFVNVGAEQVGKALFNLGGRLRESRRKREGLLLSSALETEGAIAAQELFEQHKREATTAVGFADNYNAALQERLDEIRNRALDRFDAGPNSDAVADATMQRIHTRSQVQAIQHEHNRRAGEHIAEFQQNAGRFNRLLLNDPSVDNFKRQVGAFNSSLEGVQDFLTFEEMQELRIKGHQDMVSTTINSMITNANPDDIIERIQGGEFDEFFISGDQKATFINKARTEKLRRLQAARTAVTWQQAQEDRIRDENDLQAWQLTFGVKPDGTFPNLTEQLLTIRNLEGEGIGSAEEHQKIRKRLEEASLNTGSDPLVLDFVNREIAEGRMLPRQVPTVGLSARDYASAVNNALVARDRAFPTRRPEYQEARRVIYNAHAATITPGIDETEAMRAARRAAQRDENILIGRIFDAHRRGQDINILEEAFAFEKAAKEARESRLSNQARLDDLRDELTRLHRRHEADKITDAQFETENNRLKTLIKDLRLQMDQL